MSGRMGIQVELMQDGQMARWTSGPGAQEGSLGMGHRAAV